MQGPLTLKNKMLSQPLIGITKASTPIRTRIVSNNAPLNSTPISQLKCGSSSSNVRSTITQNKQTDFNLNKENKENSNTINTYHYSSAHNNTSSYNCLNQTNLLESKKSQQKNVSNNGLNSFSKTVSFGDYKFKRNAFQENKFASCNSNVLSNLRQSGTANLSPIMALNRKLNEGPSSLKYESFGRSFTPNYVKRDQSPLYERQKQRSQQKIQKQNSIKSTSMIIQNAQKPKSLITSNSNLNLKKSNSFANLFDKRNIVSTNNTPTKLSSMNFISSISSGSKNSLSNLKQSLSFNNGDKFISNTNKFISQAGGKPSCHIAMMHDKSDVSIKQNQDEMSGMLACFNHHNKLAKYRLMNTTESCQNENEDLSSYIYCSKCAIDLVQKGFSVQQLNTLRGSKAQMIPFHSSPKQQTFSNFRQSNSFHSKFLNFKPSMANEMQEKVKMMERIKVKLTNQISQSERKHNLLDKKHSNELEQIDCYYNSLISYIEQQRAKDKVALQSLVNQIAASLLPVQSVFPTFDSFEQHLKQNMDKIQHLLKYNKSLSNNTTLMKELQEIQRQIDEFRQYGSNINEEDYSEMVEDPSLKIITFDIPIQEQFDDFVAYLDNYGKLRFRTFNGELINGSLSDSCGQNTQVPLLPHSGKVLMGKNNALRFSFQKALQNQNKKKVFLQSQMNPLQQEPQEEYEQNSFNQQNCQNINAQSTQNTLQNGQQKPFRTLFAEEDDIIQDLEEEDMPKKTIYSPHFKVI